MKKLTIDRNEWGRVKQGKPYRRGRLYDDHSKTLCCMGFHCEQIHGRTREEMDDVGMPNDVGVYDLDDLAECLEAVNDRANMFFDRPRAPDWSNVTDEQQEQLIAAGFWLVGVEVEFVN